MITELLKAGVPATVSTPTIQCPVVPLPKLRHWAGSFLGITEHPHFSVPFGREVKGNRILSFPHLAAGKLLVLMRQVHEPGGCHTWRTLSQALPDLRDWGDHLLGTRDTPSVCPVWETLAQDTQVVHGRAGIQTWIWFHPSLLPSLCNWGSRSWNTWWGPPVQSVWKNHHGLISHWLQASHCKATFVPRVELTFEVLTGMQNDSSTGYVKPKENMPEYPSCG